MEKYVSIIPSVVNPVELPGNYPEVVCYMYNLMKRETTLYTSEIKARILFSARL